MSLNLTSSALPPQEDFKEALLATWWTCFSIATVFILLRVWARALKRSHGLDDVAMGLAWLCFLADTILVHYVAATGRTQHMAWLAAGGAIPAVERAVELYVIVLAVGIFLTGLGKMAIGITILRIIGNTSRWQTWAVCIVMFLTISTCIMDFGLSVFRCGNPVNTWTIASWATANCVPSQTQTNINTFANSIQVFADFAFSILPMAIVYNLRIARRRKWFLVISLGLTMITGVAGTLKTFHAATMNHNDLTWAIFPALVWFAIESVLIFVCGTVPSLHPLYERYIKTRRRRHGSQDSPARVWSATNVKSAGHDGFKTSSAKASKVPWAGDSFGGSQYTINDNDAQVQEPNPSLVELVRLTNTPPAATSINTMPRLPIPAIWAQNGRINVVREVAVSMSPRQGHR